MAKRIANELTLQAPLGVSRTARPVAFLADITVLLRPKELEGY